MNVFGTLTLKASTDWCYCLHGQRLSHHGYRPHCRYVFPTIGNLTLCNFMLSGNGGALYTMQACFLRKEGEVFQK